MVDDGSNETTPPHRASTSGRMVSPKTIGAVLVGVLALIFVFQNTSSGQVNLYFWHITAPAWLWLVLLFGAGVVVGSLFPWFRRRQRST